MSEAPPLGFRPEVAVAEELVLLHGVQAYSLALSQSGSLCLPCPWARLWTLGARWRYSRSCGRSVLAGCFVLRLPGASDSLVRAGGMFQRGLLLIFPSPGPLLLVCALESDD